jgi:hypothetical protein
MRSTKLRISALVTSLAAIAWTLFPIVALPYDISMSITAAELTTYARGVRAKGTAGLDAWLLTDNAARMLVLDNETDARNALAVAQRHTGHCWVGRANTRVDRSNYIVPYWSGDSGIVTSVSPEDCIRYNAATLSITNPPASVPPSIAQWFVVDGPNSLLSLSSAQDAQDALVVAQRYTGQCFIGRGNQRADRQLFIAHYWTGDSTFEGALSREDCYRYEPLALRVIEERQWAWAVVDPEFRVSTSGVVLVGSISVQYAGTTTTVPFQLPATVTYSASNARLRLTVASTRLPISVPVGTEIRPIGGLAIGPHYSTELRLEGAFRPASGRINVKATGVSVQLRDGSLFLTGDATY